MSNSGQAEGDGSGDETSSVGSSSTFTESTSRSRSETPTFSATKGRRAKRGRKRKPVTSVPYTSNAPYKYNCHMVEDHGKEIFGIAFNNYLSENDPKVFAAVGSNRVTIYECPKDGGLEVLMVFGDPVSTENYYTCAWSYNEGGWPLLAVAGAMGVIRVINVKRGKCVRNFTGHGSAVNDLKFHPKDPAVLLSASKDHTLRLWNVKTMVCIAVLGKVEGHRDEVLSADFNSDGDLIMSSGMDHALKLWRLDGEKVKTAMANSHELMYDPRFAEATFDTCNIDFPDFTTRDIHKNYVDCVRWLGDIVLSKSCDNCIICWKPGRMEDQTLRQNDTKWTLIHRFEYTDCEIWYMRFATHFDENQKILALGNKSGKVYVWNLDENDPAQSKYYELSHPKCKQLIRQVSVYKDGSMMVVACDDSSVWRWDRVASTKGDPQPDR